MNTCTGTVPVQKKVRTFHFPQERGACPEVIAPKSTSQVKSSQVKSSQVKSTESRSYAFRSNVINWLIECETHWSIARNRKNVYIW